MAAPTRADARRSVDAIHVAAREVLGRGATPGLDEIAALAGVHRATLYRHFPSREDLIASLYRAYLSDADAAIRETDLEVADLRAEIEALIRRVYAVNLTWRAFAWAPAYALEDDPPRAELASRLAELFTVAQERGVLRSDMSVRLLLTTWGAPVLFYTSRILVGEFTLDEVVEHTLVLLTVPR